MSCSILHVFILLFHLALASLRRVTKDYERSCCFRYDSGRWYNSRKDTAEDEPGEHSTGGREKRERTFSSSSRFPSPLFLLLQLELTFDLLPPFLLDRLDVLLARPLLPLPLHEGEELVLLWSLLLLLVQGVSEDTGDESEGDVAGSGGV